MIHGFFKLHMIYWLDIWDRITFKLVVMVHRCLHGWAPKYLAVHCVPLSIRDDLVLRTTSPTQYVRCTATKFLPLLVRQPGTVFLVSCLHRYPNATKAVFRSLL